MVRKRICERTRLDARARMNDQPGRLIDYYEIGILIDDIERNRFRQQLRRGRFRKIYVNLVPRMHTVAWLSRPIVHENIAVVDRTLKAGAADLFYLRCQERIEPATLLFVADNKCGGVHEYRGSVVRCP